MKPTQSPPDAKNPKGQMVEHPAKEDVHEQREPDQKASGMVGGAQAAGEPARAEKKPHPWRQKPRTPSPQGSAAEPPRTPDTKNRPD